MVRQVIAFRVRSELFLSDATYSVRVHDLENGQTILLDADPPGGDSFKYYKQNLVIGSPVCLELRLSNNLSAARAEEDLRDPVMSDQNEETFNEGEEQPAPANDKGIPGAGTTGKFSVSGMYRDWFLDYASYVILERAVPALYDGLKPVQRRILHSMKDLDDGRYNKVANIIGHTMQYHPHGDASIGDALVQLGQKDLLIDCQGNWGNTLTGDSAAAPRYIEARLSKFAHDVVFNPKTTDWQLSYDGRNKEPVFLPVKFPLLLAQGGEGIAVGLSCKVLPHNFNELIDAQHRRAAQDVRSIWCPTSPRAVSPMWSNYNEGERGGRVRCRARIRKEDNKTLVISEIALRHHHHLPDREHHQGQRQGQDQGPPHRGQHGRERGDPASTSRPVSPRTTPSMRSTPSRIAR